MATALITGGTSGIGLAFARRLAGQGFQLVLVARDADRLARTADEIGAATGVEVETLPADLADRADVARVADRLADPQRPVEMLVSNAGYGLRVPLATGDLAVHEQGMAVMAQAVLVLGNTAARAMLSRGRGTIINVSSTAGFLAMGGYSALKAWVTAYSESLAVELRGTGVRVTALCPGWVRTEFHDRAGINMSAVPDWLWTDSDQVVAIGLRDAARGKVICIPTVRYRSLMWWVRHLPRSAIRAVSAKLTARRRTAAGTGG